MIKQPFPELQLRPKLIHSITAGFEAVASHLWLIILPVLVDLFLWFGPHLRVHDLLSDTIQNFTPPASLQGTDFTQMFELTRQVYLEAVVRFNLFSAFRTLPLGIPSLLAASSPLTNPLGSPLLWEARSADSAVMTWLVLSLAGLIGTSFYLNAISRVTGGDDHPVTPGIIGWQTLQLLYVVILSVLILGFLLLPVLMLVSFLTVAAPVLGQIGLFLAGLFVIWIITPMLFTPQVIFLQHQGALKALLASIRMVRFALPTTGIFFLTLVILSQGLNLLWLVPEENSWLFLVGILGHALVSTSLMAAAFIYYRDAVKWVQAVVERNNIKPPDPSLGKRA